MADLNFYYNQQLNSWVAMDITKVDATTMHNMMKTGNPYGYNSGVPSSANLYFNNADAVNDFGHGVSLTDFDAYKKFNFNNPAVKI